MLSARESVVVGTPEEIRAALASAQPGTTIQIKPGNYLGGFSAKNLHGTEKAPIMIEAHDPEKPPVFEGGASAFHLSGTSHLFLSKLIFTGQTGNGLNIDDGGSGGEPSHHVHLRALQILATGPKGNCDGIKLSGVDDFIIADCDIQDWGSGGSGIDMVGCHRGMILANQLTHQGGEGSNGVQIKGGSSEIVVQRCTFTNTGARGVNIGGSTGLEFFRPPVTGQGDAEARKITVQGCRFEGSQAPIAFVGVDGAVVRHNTIKNPGRWAIRILQETTQAGFVPCRGGVFEENLVIFKSTNWASGGVNIGANTDPKSFSFRGNWWYCEDAPERSRPTLPVEEKDAVYGKKPSPEAKVGAALFDIE